MKKSVIVFCLLILAIPVVAVSNELTLRNIAYASAKSDYNAIHVSGEMAFHQAYQAVLIIEKYLHKAGIYVPYAGYWRSAFKRQVQSGGKHKEFTDSEYIAFLKMYIELARTIQSVM